MVSVTFHKVVKVEAEKIGRLGTGSYARRIIAKDETGRTVELVLFSDEKAKLAIEAETKVRS
jgi:hypothetical protein